MTTNGRQGLPLLPVISVSRHTPGGPPAVASRPTVNGAIRWFKDEPKDPLVVDGKHGAQVEKIIEEIKHADRFLEANIDPPTRLLFIGPSGTGKTLTAHWIAHRLGLPLAVTQIDSIVSKWIGEAGRIMRGVVDEVLRVPAILFLDELDGLTAKRGQGNAESARSMLALLQQLDAMPKTQIVIGATNRVERLDTALARRLYERVYFKVPNEAGRRAMVTKWLSRAPVTDEEREALIVECKGKSGATLHARAMRVARAAVMREARRGDQ